MSKYVTKKLVYVLNYVHPDDTQHFVHVLNLLRVLKMNFGWEICLLSEKGGVGVQIVHGMKVTYLSNKGGLIRLLSLIHALYGLKKRGYSLVFIRITKPAAIVSSIFGRLMKIKSLYWQSSANFDLDRRKTFLKRIFDDFLMASIVKNIDHFVTGPDHMLSYYEENYRVPTNKLLLLYNDIDLSRFLPIEKKENNSKSLTVLFVHSLSPSKNAAMYIPYIIDKINSLADKGWMIQLILIGDGAERSIISQQILKAKQEVSVRMLGAIPNTDIPRYLSNADIFIMPSYREGMPRALMEAMAMGLPCIATDAGGTKDIVGPKQLEYVVSRDNPELFARKLGELIESDRARSRVSAENLERIKRFDTFKVAAMFDRELSDLL